MDQVVQICKIFSDINRMKIVLLIKKYKEVCVCEICDTLKLSQPLVSRHLKMMKKVGIVESLQSGKWVIYKLKDNSTVNCLIAKTDLNTIPPIVKCSRN